MLITGGYRDPHSRTALRSAEVFLPSTNSSCRLAEMRSARYRHSLTGLLACGGEGGEEESRRSCEELRGGGWTEGARLASQGRAGHTAWEANGSVLLMGDFTDQEDSQAETTEIIETNTNTSDSFYQLKLKIRWEPYYTRV